MIAGGAAAFFSETPNCVSKEFGPELATFEWQGQGKTGFAAGLPGKVSAALRFHSLLIMQLSKLPRNVSLLFCVSRRAWREYGMIELRYSTWDGKVHSQTLPKGRTLLGRTADNNIAVDDLAVSARHCEFEVLDDKVIVRDLDSAGGTFLDGHLVKEAPVKPGQTLNLGAFTIQIEAAKVDRQEGKKPQEIPAPPAQLSDGTYSCMQHRETRAAFECDRCYTLFCSECFPEGAGFGRRCPSCHQELRVLDWSGMERTAQAAVKDLLPAEVKKVLKYWQKAKN